MEILHPVLLGVLLGTLFRLRLAAGDDEAVLLRGDVEFALTEAGDRHHDAIGVLADLLDVVGRIAQGAFLAHRVQGLKQAVEADGGAIARGTVDGTHVHILLCATWLWSWGPPCGSNTSLR